LTKSRTNIFLLFFILGILFSTISCQKKYTDVSVIQTTKNGDKLFQKEDKYLSSNKKPEFPIISIDPEKKYQKIIGFGGAFTEASAHVLQKLSPQKREEVLRAYFSQDGAAYSLTRTHMGSCDFSLSSYAYADKSGGKELANFSIKEDMDDLVPLIKDAMQVNGANFKIVSSAWTAPPWMKDNQDWFGGSLLPEYYDTWALYYCKYIQEYKKIGIPIWAITTLNEPLGNGAQWESMIFTPQQMAKFVKQNLGPKFNKKNIDSKILIYDQNRDHLEDWANTILGDSATAKYVWGIAVHWYSSTVDWYPKVLNSVHKNFPDKHLMHTEGCIDAEVPVWQDDKWYWSRKATDWGYNWAPEDEKHLHPKYVPVYRYARDIIGGLNCWLTGWIDWNIVLNSQGGPNHAENWCIAPIIAKPEKNEVYYTPLYYIMAHFSKYIRPGAFRIGVETDIEDLMITACLNPDQSIVVEVLNQNSESKDFCLELGNKKVEIKIPESALQTIVIN